MSKQQKKIFITIGFLLLLPYSEIAATVVKLERTGCMGECPVYNLMVYGDGTVIYEGYDNVEIRGMHIAHISRSKVNELIYEINKANFFAFEPQYRLAATDLATITTLVRLGLRAKKVERYGKGPYELICLERKIDKVANSDQWVGRFSVVNERRPRCNS